MVATFRMRKLNPLSDSKQVCLVRNPNSQSDFGPELLGSQVSLFFFGKKYTIFYQKRFQCLNWIFIIF